MSKTSPGLRRLVLRALNLAAVTSMAIAPLAIAADNGGDSFSTDRPEFVPSTSLTGNGNMQLETSVAHLQDGSDARLLRVWSTPTLVRLGIRSYEIRLQSSAYSHVRTQTVVDAGMSNLELGLKGLVPQTLIKDASLAWIAAVAFPSGASQLRKSAAFSSGPTQVRNDVVRPSAQLIGQW